MSLGQSLKLILALLRRVQTKSASHIIACMPRWQYLYNIIWDTDLTAGPNIIMLRVRNTRGGPAGMLVSIMTSTGTQLAKSNSAGWDCWENYMDESTPTVATYVAQIFSSQQTACAIVAPEYSIICWGWNGNGELGGTTAADYALDPRDSGSIDLLGSDVGDVLNVTTFTYSSYHFCAKLTGGFKCWGDNTRGQLGWGETSPVRSLKLTLVF